MGGCVEKQETRLDFHLENWSAWMRSDAGVMGYGRKSAGFSGSVNSQSFDELVEQSDVWLARRVNTHIRNLDPAEQAAVEVRYGICRVYRFPRHNYAELLLAARIALADALAADGIW